METLDLGDGSPDTQIESLNIAVSEFKVWILLNNTPRSVSVYGQWK